MRSAQFAQSLFLKQGRTNPTKSGAPYGVAVRNLNQVTIMGIYKVNNSVNIVT